MKKCPKCGYECMDYALRCGNCGAYFEEQQDRREIHSGPESMMSAPEENELFAEEVPKKGKKGRIILAAALVVLLAAGIGLGIWWGNSHSTAAQVQTNLEEGDKYLEQMDYESAIRFYQLALQQDDTQEEPYIRLYQAYMAMSDFGSANSVLSAGIEKTGSQRMRVLVMSLIQKTGEGTVDGENLSEEEIHELEANVDVNASILQKLGRYRSSEFVAEFGQGTGTMAADGACLVNYKNLSASVLYRNDGGKVSFDTATATPLAQSYPESITFQDIGVLFRNFQGAVSKKYLEETLHLDVYVYDLEEAGSKVVSFTLFDALIEIACNENGDIVNSHAWNRMSLRTNEDQEEYSAGYAGVVIDAVSGQNLYGVTLTFVSTQDSTMEAVQAVTGSYGEYEAELMPGSYEVTAELDGYISEVFYIEVQADQQLSGDTVAMSPELGSGEIRIVLTWGASPRDLDSYLQGNTDSGQNVYTSYRSQTSAANGNVLANLDLDDVSGYGPETTTVYDINGVYDFWVEDFHHTGEIGSSNAIVRVYLPNSSSPTEIAIPSGSGNQWQVCRIDHGKISVINSIS